IINDGALLDGATTNIQTVTLKDGGLWKNAGGASVANFDFEGTVDIRSMLPGNYTQFTVTTLNASGEAIVDMNARIDKDAPVADILVLDGEYNGLVLLRVHNTDGTGGQMPGNGLKLVDGSASIGGDGTVELLGGKSDLGGYEYDLFKGGPKGGEMTDYFLRLSTRYTNMLRTVTNIPIMNVVMTRTGINSLERRLGDLRAANGESSHGMWARTYGKQHKVTELIETDMTMFGVEGGYDYQFNAEGSNRFFAGLMGGYMVSDVKTIMDSGRHSEGNGTAPSVGAYGTWLNDSGWFVDLTARNFWTSLDMKNITADGQVLEYRPERSIFAASVELGKTFKAEVNKDNYFRIEPKVEFKYHKAAADVVPVKNGMGDLTFSGAEHMTGKAAMLIGFTKMGKNGLAIAPYLEVAYSSEFSGSEDVSYGGAEHTSDLSGSIIEGTVGLNVGITEGVYVYGQATIEQGDKFEGIGGNLGIRVSFGGDGKQKRAEMKAREERIKVAEATRLARQMIEQEGLTKGGDRKVIVKTEADKVVYFDKTKAAMEEAVGAKNVVEKIGYDENGNEYKYFQVTYNGKPVDVDPFVKQSDGTLVFNDKFLADPEKELDQAAKYMRAKAAIEKVAGANNVIEKTTYDDSGKPHKYFEVSYAGRVMEIDPIIKKSDDVTVFNGRLLTNAKRELDIAAKNAVNYDKAKTAIEKTAGVDTVIEKTGFDSNGNTYKYYEIMYDGEAMKVYPFTNKPDGTTVFNEKLLTDTKKELNKIAKDDGNYVKARQAIGEVVGLDNITEKTGFDEDGNPYKYFRVMYNGKAVDVLPVDIYPFIKKVDGTSVFDQRLLTNTSGELDRAAKFETAKIELEKTVGSSNVVEKTAYDSKGHPYKYFEVTYAGRVMNINPVTKKADGKLVFNDKMLTNVKAELDKTVELYKANKTKNPAMKKFNLDASAFKTGSAKLSERAQKIVRDQAEDILKYKFTKIIIEGHTDSTGSEAVNKKLSKARAKAVYDVFLNLGVDPDKMEYVGYGSSRPKGDNGTKEGRAQNRRTEVFIE
ncbi:MAG: autotransporter outer membrane beta-barrel domain-containing protein, partial [Endomicrobia bacterium]|nr:autotransporter outer membrane beta-barrel domain-containing protein [Endomicrobiia bacterium]